MPAEDAGTGPCRSPHLMVDSHVHSEPGGRPHHGAYTASSPPGPGALPASILAAAPPHEARLAVVYGDDRCALGDACLVIVIERGAGVHGDAALCIADLAATR